MKRTSSRRAVYGFALSITVIILAALVLLWAYLPDPYLRAIGITYYPSKCEMAPLIPTHRVSYWALAVPTYVLVTLVFFVPLGYAAINLTITAPLDSPVTLTRTRSACSTLD